MFRVFFLAAALALTACVPVVNAQSTLWGWDLGGAGGLFNLDDAAAPATWTYFRPPTYSAFAMEFDHTTGELYAFDNDGFTIGTIDPSNGAYSAIAPISGDLDTINFNVLGLMYDVTDGSWYCCSSQDLFSIDIGTGVTTLIGSFAGVGFDNAINVVITADIDNTGQLYAFEFDDSQASGTRGDNGRLWEVDKTSGAMVVLGNSGVNEVGFVQGMDFDPDTNVLYSAIFAFDGAAFLGDYGTWDLSTPGAASFTALAPLSDGNPNMELVFAIDDGVAYGQDVFNDVFASFDVNDISTWNPLSIDIPTVWSLEAGDDGTIYCIDNNGAGLDDFLGTLDPATGVFSSLLPLSGDYLSNGTQQPAALTQDSVTGIWYVIDLISMYEMDITTGVCTLIGTFDAGVLAIEGSAYDGQMFVFDAGVDSLIEVSLIDASTVATVGAIGLDVGLFIQGMDHDENGVLYQAAVDTTGALGDGPYGTWDIGAGTFTEITPTNSLPDPDADGVAPKITFQSAPVGELDIAPTSLTITAGNLNAGGLPELLNNDSADLSIFRSPQSVTPRTEFVVSGVSQTANPTTLDVTLEGSCFARTSVTQSIALFNFTTNSYDVVSSTNASLFFDNAVTASATGSLADYVGPGNELRARVRFQGGIPRLVFTSNTDQFFWTVE